MVTRWIGSQLNDDGAARVVTVGKGYAAQVSFTRPADILAYLAGDVIGAAVGASAALAFTSIGPESSHILVNNADLRIDDAAIPAGMTSFRLHLYDTAPPSALGDNVPWDLPAADRPYYLGFIDLGSPADVGSTLFTQAAVGKSLLLRSIPSLFGYLVTTAGYTPVSAIAHTVRLNTEAK